MNSVESDQCDVNVLALLYGDLRGQKDRDLREGYKVVKAEGPKRRTANSIFTRG